MALRKDRYGVDVALAELLMGAECPAESMLGGGAIGAVTPDVGDADIVDQRVGLEQRDKSGREPAAPLTPMVKPI